MRNNPYKTIPTLFSGFILAAGLLLLSGCGGKRPATIPPPSTVTITGKVEAPSGPGIERIGPWNALDGLSASSNSRVAALAGVVPLAGAAVTLVRMDSQGNLAGIQGISAVTDSSGNYSLDNVSVIEDNLIIQAALDGGGAGGTTVVRGIVSLSSADVGETKENINLNVETTLLVEELKNVCLSSGLPAKEVASSSLAGLLDAIESGLSFHIEHGGEPPDLSDPSKLTSYLAGIKTTDMEGKWKVTLSSAAGQNFSGWIFRVDESGSVTEGGYQVERQGITGSGLLSGSCSCFMGGEIYCNIIADQELGGSAGAVSFFINLKMNDDKTWFRGTWSSASDVFQPDKGAFNSSSALYSIAVEPDSLFVFEDDTFQFTATATYIDDSTEDITSKSAWASSNEDAATVNNGLLTAVSPGRAQITAARDGVSSQPVEVIVIDKSGAPQNLQTTAREDVEDTIDITWAMPDLGLGAGSLLGFNIYRSVTSASGYVMINESLIDKDATSYTDRDVMVGITYYYVMTAVYDTEPPSESIFSAEASATVLADEDAIRKLVNDSAQDLADHYEADGDVVYECEYTSIQIEINGSSAIATGSMYVSMIEAGSYATDTLLYTEIINYHKENGVWVSDTTERKDSFELLTTTYSGSLTDMIAPTAPVLVVGVFSGDDKYMKSVSVTDESGRKTFLSYLSASWGGGYIKAPSIPGETMLTIRAESALGKVYEFIHKYTVYDVYSPDQTTIAGVFETLEFGVENEDINTLMSVISPTYNDGFSDYAGIRTSYEDSFSNTVVHSSSFRIESIEVNGDAATVTTREVREYDDSPAPEWSFGPAKTTKERKAVWTLARSEGNWLITSYAFQRACEVISPLDNPVDSSTYIIVDCYDQTSDNTISAKAMIAETGKFHFLATMLWEGCLYGVVDTSSTPGTNTAAITAVDANGVKYLMNLIYNLH